MMDDSHPIQQATTRSSVAPAWLFPSSKFFLPLNLYQNSNFSLSLCETVQSINLVRFMHPGWTPVIAACDCISLVVVVVVTAAAAAAVVVVNPTTNY